MTIAIAGLVLVVISGFSVWCAASRFWHVLVIAGLAVLLFPLVATQLTGDVSLYLPAGTFSEGIAGKDEIVLASAAATVPIAIILAACAWAAAKVTWRSVRGRMR